MFLSDHPHHHWKARLLSVLNVLCKVKYIDHQFLLTPLTLNQPITAAVLPYLPKQRCISHIWNILTVSLVPVATKPRLQMFETEKVAILSENEVHHSPEGSPIMPT